MHDPSRTNGEMTNLAVSHLAFWKTNMFSRSFYQTPGIGFQEVKQEEPNGAIVDGEDKGARQRHAILGDGRNPDEILALRRIVTDLVHRPVDAIPQVSHIGDDEAARGLQLEGEAPEGDEVGGARGGRGRVGVGDLGLPPVPDGEDPVAVGAEVGHGGGVEGELPAAGGALHGEEAEPPARVGVEERPPPRQTTR